MWKFYMIDGEVKEGKDLDFFLLVKRDEKDFRKICLDRWI